MEAKQYLNLITSLNIIRMYEPPIVLPLPPDVSPIQPQVDLSRPETPTPQVLKEQYKM
jgi:hypothetical protein